jgi:hypothetical protein
VVATRWLDDEESWHHRELPCRFRAARPHPALNRASRAAEKTQLPGESWSDAGLGGERQDRVATVQDRDLRDRHRPVPVLETKQSSFCASVLSKIALAMVPARLGVAIRVNPERGPSRS